MKTTTFSPKVYCIGYILAFLLLISNYDLSCAASVITGKVVGVSDGDTITVLQNNQQYKIRFYGIDCPESGQAFGQKAKQFTSSLAFGKTAEVTVYDVDKYQRSVGVVRVDGINVNEELLKNGFAWRYTQYCKESFCNAWKGLEEQATKQGVGLWSEKNPMPPWDWRHSPQREQQIISNLAGKQRQPAAYKESVSAGTLHGNTKSGVYHNSGCRWYNCKNCTHIFHSSEEARAAGYHSCQQCGG